MYGHVVAKAKAGASIISRSSSNSTASSESRASVAQASSTGSSSEPVQSSVPESVYIPSTAPEFDPGRPNRIFDENRDISAPDSLMMNTANKMIRAAGLPITCPADAAPGLFIRVEAPTGQQFLARVPEGCAPGQTFVVPIPDPSE